MIRNRIKELRHVLASDLRANPRNYRKHPPRQKALLKQLLSEVGYADALIAYESQGELILIDGHLRAETTPDQMVPVLVLDVTEQEAKKLLLTLDPLAAMAETDAAILGDLLKVAETSGEVDVWLKERAEGSSLGIGVPLEETSSDYSDRTIKQVSLQYSLSEYDLIMDLLTRAGEALGTTNHSDTVRSALEVALGNR